MSQGADWSRPPIVKRKFALETWTLGRRYWYWVPILSIVLSLAAAIFFESLLVGFVMLLALAPAIYFHIVSWGWYCGLFYSVEIMPDAISGGSDLGNRIVFRLDSIVSANAPWYACGFGLIVKSSESRLRIWFPWFIKEKQEFLDSLSQVAGTSHPLYVALDRKWNKAST